MAQGVASPTEVQTDKTLGSKERAHRLKLNDASSLQQTECNEKAAEQYCNRHCRQKTAARIKLFRNRHNEHAAVAPPSPNLAILDALRRGLAQHTPSGW
eukprot:CAMPEP_0119362836 /NCGR_PEP_ID=MMETSP1334-20130426/9762_1 /TAXON_ID=127549 /ORGANISM="Calcidiscus leptoporus, Strain RCC1130" /LENGTH=98 /DNA_ID=CAMNT_0007378097 /DNA_START=120 /DNA_END=416 /DNA_ORIENTATION=-